MRASMAGRAKSPGPYPQPGNVLASAARESRLLRSFPAREVSLNELVRTATPSPSRGSPLSCRTRSLPSPGRARTAPRRRRVRPVAARQSMSSRIPREPSGPEITKQTPCPALCSPAAATSRPRRTVGIRTLTHRPAPPKRPAPRCPHLYNSSRDHALARPVGPVQVLAWIPIAILILLARNGWKASLGGRSR